MREGGPKTGNEGAAGRANTGKEGERDRSWRLSRGMRDLRANKEQVLARIAARQHGVVSTPQLRDAGVGKHAVFRRVEAGRLHPLHRGVYAVGHRNLSFEGRCMAAVLAL